MDKTQTISVFLFILLTSQIVSIEGRQTKPNKRIKSKSTAARQTTSSQLQITAEQHESPQIAPTQRSAFSVPAGAHIDDFRPTSPGNSPGVGHRFEGGKADTKAFVESPDVKWIDDFQPTTPGNSPGVGHAFVSGRDNIATNHPSKNNGVRHPLAGDDYRATMPGRSPGVGHSHGQETTEPHT